MVLVSISENREECNATAQVIHTGTDALGYRPVFSCDSRLLHTYPVAYTPPFPVGIADDGLELDNWLDQMSAVRDDLRRQLIRVEDNINTARTRFKMRPIKPTEFTATVRKEEA